MWQKKRYAVLIVCLIAHQCCAMLIKKAAVAVASVAGAVALPVATKFFQQRNTPKRPIVITSFRGCYPPPQDANQPSSH